MKSSVFVYIRNIGYLLGFFLLVYQTYKGVLAIQKGLVTIPETKVSLLALSIAILALASQMIAWWILMKGLGADRIPLSKVFWGYTLTFLPRYIPGTIWGYMSRGNWLKEEFYIDYKKSTMGSILELILMVVVNVVLAGVIFLPKIGNKLSTLLLLSILLVIPIYFVLYNRSTKFRNVLLNINLKYLLFSIIFLLITWFFYGASLLVLSEPFSTFQFLEYERIFLYTAIFSSAWLIGFLVVFVPAGMGVREIALSFLLTSYLPMDPNMADALSIFFRLVMSLSEISWLILGWGVRRFYLQKPGFLL